MSIFKESFPRFVRNQLNIREQIIASGEKGGQKSDNFFTYSLNKQCTIRLSSGVNLNDNSEGLIPENKTFTKSQLAKKWVLQGGVLWRRTPDITLNRDGEPSFSNLQLKNINSEHKVLFVGPHVSALPIETLSNESSIDMVCFF